MDYKYLYNEINQYNKNKYKYNIYEAILRLLDIDICLLSIKDINIKSTILKNKLANDLISKKFYKLFDYNLKKQKNIIYTFLTSNNIHMDISNNIIKYISIYLNLNILLIKNNLYRFINEYNIYHNTIILIQKENKFIPYIYSYNNIYINFFNNIYIQEIIKLFNFNYEIIIDDNIPFSIQFNKIKKYKLENIYNICSHYNIDLYDNLKNLKTKKYLFEELYNILY
jgi:hypothetical protein